MKKLADHTPGFYSDLGVARQVVALCIHLCEIPIVEIDEYKARFMSLADTDDQAAFYAEIAAAVSLYRWGTP